jgi:alpha-N-arabinofuranosidase
MDGQWQIGHKTAGEYGRLANMTGRAMKSFDRKLELVVCGSTHPSMPTYPAWDAEVLEECYEVVDYVSLHTYFENYEDDYLNFVAKPVAMDRYIHTVLGVCDYVRAKTRLKNVINISFDEWNVWFHNRRQDHDNFATWDWPVAPPLLEEAYDFDDILVVGCALNTFIRRADRVKIACVAQLVNVIAPIMTVTGGTAWKQTIYYPLYFASLHGRGEALDVVVDVPTYDARVANDVPYLDISAVKNTGGKTLTLFAVNRHPTEALSLDVGLAGLKPKSVIEHIVMAHSNPRAVNTAKAPNTVVPRRKTGTTVADGALKARLPPRSYHVIRVAV